MFGQLVLDGVLSLGRRENVANCAWHGLDTDERGELATEKIGAITSLLDLGAEENGS